LIILFALIT